MSYQFNGLPAMPAPLTKKSSGQFKASLVLLAQKRAPLNCR